jgi:hypothetical protein
MRLAVVRLAGLAWLAWLAGGCDDPPAPVHGGGLGLPAFATAAAPLDPEQAQQGAVAARAARAGYWSEERLGRAYRRALAQAFLQDRFEARYDASQVPREDLVRIYGEKNVRILYDHFDSYRVADVQFVCCGTHYSQCKASETQACIDANLPVMQAIYEEHVVGRAHNGRSLQVLAEEVLASKYPQIKYMTYSFFYNPGVAYEQQKGYYLYNRNVVQAAAVTPAGKTARPVASNNGLHIVHVLDHLPAVHRTLEDPEVEQDILERVLPGYRQRDAAIFLDSLRSQHGVQVHPEALEKLLITPVR